MPRQIGGLAAAILILTPTSVLAQERPEADPAEPPSTASAAASPLNPEELATLNGRQGQSNVHVLSEQDLVAVNNGNTISADRVSSGPISIGPSAFDGFAGVGNFVINSGHNNNLQGAITINIVQP